VHEGRDAASSPASMGLAGPGPAIAHGRDETQLARIRARVTVIAFPGLAHVERGFRARVVLDVAGATLRRELASSTAAPPSELGPGPVMSR